MIPQRNLSLLSNRLAKKGERRIPESVLERDYCLSWFLVGLSESSLKNVLLFKGGTALKKCYFPDYRFSEDLDFTLNANVTLEDILEGFNGVFANVYEKSAVRFFFSCHDRRTHENSFTFFLGYEGPLPGSSGKTVKVDITIREVIFFGIVEKEVLRGYVEYEDLPEGKTISVYSLEEIAIEKVVALLDRARNEPRDLYDLWFITNQTHISIAELLPAVEEKLRFRGKELDEVRGEFQRKEVRLKKLWQLRLSSQVESLPEFDHVYRAVKRELRRSGLLTR